MKLCFRIALIVIVLLLITSGVVLADVSVDITITAIPSGTGGILNFTITYVNDRQLDLDWAYGAGTSKVMIRRKYGSFPADTNNVNVAPSDGELVYFGVGNAFSDILVDLDTFNNDASVDENSDTPFTVYYKAFGQNADGTWQLTSLSGFEESKQVQAIAVILLTVFLTWLGYYMGTKNRNILLGLLGTIGWIIFMAYVRSNDFLGFTKPSLAADCFVYLSYIMMIVCPLAVLMRIRSEDNLIAKGYDISPEGQAVGTAKPPAPAERSGIMDLDNDGYRQYLRNRRTAHRARR